MSIGRKELSPLHEPESFDIGEKRPKKKQLRNQRNGNRPKKSQAHGKRPGTGPAGGRKTTGGVPRHNTKIMQTKKKKRKRALAQPKVAWGVDASLGEHTEMAKPKGSGADLGQFAGENRHT